MEFASPDIATQALKKNKETIGHRWGKQWCGSERDHGHNSDYFVAVVGWLCVVY